MSRFNFEEEIVGKAVNDLKQKFAVVDGNGNKVGSFVLHGSGAVLAKTTKEVIQLMPAKGLVKFKKNRSPLIDSEAMSKETTELVIPADDLKKLVVQHCDCAEQEEQQQPVENHKKQNSHRSHHNRTIEPVAGVTANGHV